MSTVDDRRRRRRKPTASTAATGSAAPKREESSITAVAARAGVSIATVSRIINGVPKKASANTVEKVRRAVAELGYRPSSAGRTLREGTSRLVATLAANLANPAMAAIAASIEPCMRDLGLVMVLCDTHERPELQDEYLREMRAQRVRAVVLLAAVPSPGLDAALAGGESIVFVNRRDSAGNEPFVGIDNEQAGAEVARHLVETGRRSLAIIHGPMQSSATADRVRGFTAECRRLGVRLPSGRVTTSAGVDHLDIGYRALGDLAPSRPRPDGIFCSSDLIAFGAHRRALELGLRVPEDLAIVGFDDSPLNDWVTPWLTSVRVPYDEFGRAIADVLDGIWGGAASVSRILQHRLVPRSRG